DVRGIPGNHVSHEEAIRRYDKLIDKCDRYISKRSWGWFDCFKSPEGRERLRLARELKAHAKEMKANYLKHAVRDQFNAAVNDFANSDFASMDQNQILDKFRDLRTAENRIYNNGMNLLDRQNDARDILSAAEDSFDAHQAKKYDMVNGSRDDNIVSRAYNSKTLGEIVNEEKGINKTDSKHLADKLGIHQGVKHSGKRRSNANNNIIEDVKENTNKKQIKINN
ncbi:MAG: hypothetical protein IK123_07100, partial [Lachnospiraceae bacterium]|nr:hypothetical protein [Lachnospiraceae bacterium]